MSKLQELDQKVDFSLVDSLNKDTFLSSLSEKDRDLVVAKFDEKVFKKGEILTKAGEPQTAMFIVLKGGLKKSHKVEEVRHLKAGAITGMFHFLTKDPAFSTIEAEEDTTVWILQSDTFNQLLQDSPTLNQSYIQYLNKVVRQHAKALNSVRSALHPSGSTQIAFFDAKPYDSEAFQKVAKEGDYKVSFNFINHRLNKSVASLANGHEVVCAFVNDILDKEVIELLAQSGVKLIIMRCAGYDNVDLQACKEHDISVTRVPAYSPFAVAEFAVTLMMALNRKVHKAWNRVRDFNFSLDGLVGFDMHGRTVGLFGTGQIGKCAANILNGFGCKVIAYDVKPNPDIAKVLTYVSADELFAQSDIISIHVPLLPSTKHIINADAFKKMKEGAILINTSRGPIVNHKDLLEALQSGKIGGAGLDVYEGEQAYFYENKSESNITDDVLSRLVSSHNVIITSHQAFLTSDALRNIATSALDSVKEFTSGKKGDQLTNAVVQQYK
eukprot:TRINITY_DN3772_c0_g1_i2.p1 TRINITY_DN3772_c0_g1~~TRINITY_DN3772_c0_g1_i2.p1  ORF type:complete len:497 (-),score=181.32 TRINITY_DN3772_c0_g1_i2:56-1546(-)